MSSSPRLVLVGALLAVSAGGLEAQQQQTAAPVPVVIAGSWPQVNSIGILATSSAFVGRGG